MIGAKLPDNENQRLKRVYDLDILDTKDDEAYDAITKIAQNIMGTKFALISIIDKDRQWFKSKIGFEASETPRELAFCSHAILNPFEQMVVQDATKDERFHDHPYVTQDNGIIFRFYFGTPLVTSDNLAIGTICAVDDNVRLEPTEEQKESFKCLAKLIILQLELRQVILDINTDINKMNKADVISQKNWHELNSKCDDVMDRVKARRRK